MQKIDIEPMEKALLQLTAGLEQWRQDTGDDLRRDGLIQRFEYTYELCHKMLRRYLDVTEPSPEMLEEMSFQDIIRLASERGLILGDWEDWFQYRKKRNTTSHGYDEEKAVQVVEVIPAFVKEAEHLRDEINRRQSKHDR
jgi:nucleotidyltransferase substrate binding protein (TIGR01987 family)